MNYMVSIYVDGKYSHQLGPMTKQSAEATVRSYDGFKHSQAIAWNLKSGKDLTKSIMYFY